MLVVDSESSNRCLRVVIVIENTSYTYDSRISNIARTLRRERHQVWVICPRYPGDPWKRVEHGITVYSYPLPRFPAGVIGHLLEYIYSFVVIGVMTLTAFFTIRFDVIHICNPPDVMFLLGRFFRLLGCKFVFDLHDLCPELWQLRYRKWRLGHKLVLGVERLALKAADHVLVTSETALQRICDRGGISYHSVTMVRNGPNIEPRSAAPFKMATEWNSIEVGYVGQMNPQDGVDKLLLAAHHIRHGLGRTDIRFVLIGGGSSFDGLRRMATQLGLSDCVSFTGFLAPQDVVARLLPCDLCVQPDPKNRFNDSCVMVKSLEYMALAKPVVAFDLDETRRVCADAALYASGNCPRNLANEILALADDPTLRHNLGTRGRRRVEEQFAWSFSEPRLLNVYRSLVKSKAGARQLAV